MGLEEGSDFFLAACEIGGRADGGSVEELEEGWKVGMAVGEFVGCRGDGWGRGGRGEWG